MTIWIILFLNGIDCLRKEKHNNGFERDAQKERAPQAGR